MGFASSLELRVPPVPLAVAAGAAMWATASAPAPSLGVAPVRIALGAALALAGLLVALPSLVLFRRARTTVNPLRPGSATAFVATGPYRFSRNPMYLGLLLGLAGWASYLAAPLSAAWLLAFVLYITRFQIVPEERAMASRFGESYRAYQKSVRQWI